MCEQFGILFIMDDLTPHLRLLVADILRRLHGYNDNFAIVDRFEARTTDGKQIKENQDMRKYALEALIHMELITVEGQGRWRIAIENRYALETLARELKVVNDTLPNLIFYDITTGNGLINGKPVSLKKLNKKLFDMLFTAPHNQVDRNAIWKALGNRVNIKANNIDSLVLNEKISNLRKACRTDASVIFIDKVVTLNAEIFVYKNNRVKYREIAL